MECFLSTSFCKNKSIESSIKTCGELSNKNVELSAPHPKEDFNQIKRNLINFKKEGYDFTLHNYFPPPQKSFVLNIASNEEEVLDNCKKLILDALSLSESVGSSMYGIHAGYLSKAVEGKNGMFEFNKNERYEETLERSVNFIKFINGEFEKKNVKLLIENLFPGTKINSSLFCTLQHIDDLMDKVPKNVGLLLDLGHLNISSKFFNFNKKQFLEKYLSRYGKKLYEIHLSENDGKKDEHLSLAKDSWQYGFIREIFSEIKDNDIKPVFCLEARNASANQIKQNLDLINNIIA
jgi:sugar phosphate isomerase/epimerase